MKKVQVLLAAFAFSLAIVGAFASNSVPDTVDEGKPDDCGTTRSLNEGECYVDGSSSQCTLVTTNAPAFQTTSCQTTLNILP